MSSTGADWEHQGTFDDLVDQITGLLAEWWDTGMSTDFVVRISPKAFDAAEGDLVGDDDDVDDMWGWSARPRCVAHRRGSRYPGWPW